MQCVIFFIHIYQKIILIKLLFRISITILVKRLLKNKSILIKFFEAQKWCVRVKEKHF